MCGINAISVDSASRGAFIRNLIDMSEMQRQGRGSHSHGISFIEDEKIKSFRKLGVPDVNYLADKYKSASTGAAIGHVRLASQGKITLENAHPFFNKLVSMIHNGHVYGKHDKKVYAKKLRVTPRGDTDSEMLFHTFDNHWDGFINIESIESALIKTLNDTSGMVNLIFLFKDGTVVAYKDDTLSVLVEDGAVLFASVPPSSDENWKRMKYNQLIIAKDGKVIHDKILNVKRYNPYSVKRKNNSQKQQTFYDERFSYNGNWRWEEVTDPFTGEVVLLRGKRK